MKEGLQLFNPTQSDYKQYIGEQVIVEHPLTSEEGDIEDVGNMYKVTLVNNPSITLDAFEDDLYDPIIFSSDSQQLGIDTTYLFDVEIHIEDMTVVLSYDEEPYTAVSVIATKYAEDRPIEIVLNITPDGGYYSQIGIEEIEGYEAYKKQIENHIEDNKNIYYY